MGSSLLKRDIYRVYYGEKYSELRSEDGSRQREISGTRLSLFFFLLREIYKSYYGEDRRLKRLSARNGVWSVLYTIFSFSHAVFSCSFMKGDVYMFNKIRYAYHLTKAEQLMKRGVSIEDERIKHHQKKIEEALYKRKER